MGEPHKLGGGKTQGIGGGRKFESEGMKRSTIGKIIVLNGREGAGGRGGPAASEERANEKGGRTHLRSWRGTSALLLVSKSNSL